MTTIVFCKFRVFVFSGFASQALPNFNFLTASKLNRQLTGRSLFRTRATSHNRRFRAASWVFKRPLSFLGFVITFCYVMMSISIVWTIDYFHNWRWSVDEGHDRAGGVLDVIIYRLAPCFQSSVKIESLGKSIDCFRQECHQPSHSPQLIIANYEKSL